MVKNEFMGEEPLTPVVKPHRGTGERVSENGTYVCKSCSDAMDPPRTYLKKGEEFPICPTCGPHPRWEKCSDDILHCD